MGTASFNAKLDGQSCFRACPEFPPVVVSSDALALTAVCVQKQSRPSLRQRDAKLFCTAGKICPWSEDHVS